MEAQYATTPYAYRRRWWALAAVVVLALAVGAAVYFFFIRGGEDEPGTVTGPEDAPFTIARPADWEPLSDDELSELPGDPIAALRQEDGNGLVVINTEPTGTSNLPQLSEQIRSRLQQRVPDFNLIKSQTIQVRAGPALSISYARTKQGTSHTLLVVPGDNQTYSLSAVVPAGQQDSARDVGSILSSFDL